MYNLRTSEHDSVWVSSSDSSSDTVTRGESAPPVAPYLPLGNPAQPSPPNVLSQAAIKATNRGKIGHHMDRTGLFQEQFDLERRTNWNTAEYFPPDLRNANVDSSIRRESAPPARAPAAPYLPLGYQTPHAPNASSQVAISATDKGKIRDYMDLPRLFPEPFDMERRRKWNSGEWFSRDLRNTNGDSSSRRETAPPAAPDLPLGYEAPPAPNVLSQVAIEATQKDTRHSMGRIGLFQEAFHTERRTNWNTTECFRQDSRNTEVDSSTRMDSAPRATVPYLPLRYSETPAPNVINQGAVEDIDEEKIWLFMDATGLAPQGPYAMQTLRKFFKAGYLPQKLRIWKRTQDQEEAVFLNDALADRSQKEIEPSGSSSCAQVVKTYAQVVRINPISASIPVAQPFPASSNLTFDDNSAAKYRGKRRI